MLSDVKLIHTLLKCTSYTKWSLLTNILLRVTLYNLDIFQTIHKWLIMLNFSYIFHTFSL